MKRTMQIMIAIMVILVLINIQVYRYYSNKLATNVDSEKDYKRIIKKLNGMVQSSQNKAILLKRALKDKDHALTKANSVTQIVNDDDDEEEVKQSCEETSRDGRPYLKDPQGRYMDFLISVRFIHCSVKLAVVRINAIFNPKRIIFLSYKKEDCVILNGFAPNVHCIWEQDILPKFSPKRFVEMVEQSGEDRLLKPDPSHPADVGSFKDRAGWFFLQMINLGAGRYMKDLSEHYVVWDSDIVPLSKDMKFFTDDGKIIHYTQRQHGRPVALGYHLSYKKLTGYTIRHPSGKETPGFEGTETWVAHQMVFKRSYVDEYLSQIEKHRGVAKDMWPEEIVRVAMDKDLDGYQWFGYADYDHYGSWAYEKHRDNLHVMLGSYAKFTRPVRVGGYKEGTCCIPKNIITEHTQRGYHYIVNEIHKGDVPICRSMNFYGLYHRDLPITWQKDEDIIDSLTTEQV